MKAFYIVLKRFKEFILILNSDWLLLLSIIINHQSYELKDVNKIDFLVNLDLLEDLVYVVKSKLCYQSLSINQPE